MQNHRSLRKIFGMEHRQQPLLSSAAFGWRVFRHVAMAATLVLLSLAMGMVGYRELENMSWIDAFLNASMILGGMGPVAALQTDAGKLFAGAYALFSGIIFLVGVGLIFAPLVHRMLHHFHLEDE
ncbi:MAG TPA: hypothetical protein PLF22_11435 [Pseudomonadales bacterium]|nr:hypothetical protein [Pseudomonadales bacterium]